MKKIYKILVIFILLFMTIIFSSCKNDTISIVGEESVLEGEQITLKVETNKEAYTANWSSSNPDVASVNNYGIVTGIKEGTTTIRVSIGDLSTDTLITVTKFEINIECEKKLRVGEETQVIVSHNSNLNKEIFFSSTHTSIATIDNNGLIKALEVGTTVITVNVSGIKNNFTLTVVGEGGENPGGDDPGQQGDTTPTYESLKIDVPTIIKYDDVIIPTANKEVFWTSFNEEIVVFGEDNMILPMANGRVKIRGTDVNNHDSYVDKEIFIVMSDVVPNEIQIYTELGSNEFVMGKKEGYATSLLQLYIRAINSDRDSDVTVIWMIDNENIATINDLGVLSAIRTGTVTITAVLVLDPTITATFILNIKER